MWIQLKFELKLELKFELDLELKLNLELYLKLNLELDLELVPIVRGFSNNQIYKATLYLTGFSTTSHLNITNIKLIELYQLCH